MSTASFEVGQVAGVTVIESRPFRPVRTWTAVYFRPFDENARIRPLPYLPPVMTLDHDTDRPKLITLPRRRR